MDYKFKVKQGIDDLKSLSPYFSEWGTFSPHYEVSEEEYLANPKSYEDRIKKDNADYIEQLKLNEQYGKEVELVMSIPFNESFDKKEPTTKDYPLQSYKFLIIDI